ncbi:Anti-sigma regulatory factor (Ser/Thr protein kinase) [Thermosyntropha lipolytica DSM 11003]|uniref:Anti-sigma regulatory factor (Ser/Thr protein kinase) n=1 Tax=Thermosyntropha lipolytica DSM 11003 TaxID=1123382 RepID=A0A1M5L8Y2_9FIRM|nr:SpoIIE family protein phosphatase [Thermosyntropha lipolytica]SHG61487.1 Anti-sigma regulatory factor (Ser/Thr protein kinase) [Thermosyntropha lipolytica DSM 11003]
MKDSLRVDIRDSADLFILEYRVKKFLQKNRLDRKEIILITRELGTNILKYGGYGYIELMLKDDDLDIVAFDYGKGPKDNIPADLSPGLGLGLKVVKSYADRLTINNNEEGGWTVALWIKLCGDNGKKINRLEYGIASRPHKREKRSGDVAVVKNINGFYVIVVADVLGHGDKAADIGDKIYEAVDELVEANILKVFQHIENRILNTRGCELFVASIGGNVIDYINIGNIRAWKITAKNIKRLAERPGIVGRQPVPAKINREIDNLYQSLLLICTDGIISRFVPSHDYIDIDAEPQYIADKILEDFGSYDDDATCVVVRG